MMNIFYIKRRDTSPAIRATLSTDAGPVNLTGASVWFHLKSITTQQATIVNAATGQVEYEWQAGDTDKAGYFDAEWEVVFSDGKKETFPNHGYATVKITADIGEPI